jgi:hypothetical protein
MLPASTPFLLSRVLRKIPSSISKVVAAWLKWFWRLATSAKVVVTAGEIICLWLILPHIPIGSSAREALLEVGSIGLMFFLIGAVLFSRPARR